MFSHAEDWFLGSTAILFIWLYCKTNHLFLLSWVWPTSRASWWCWVAGSSVSQVVSECVSECVMSVMSVSFKIDFSLQSSTITSEINTCCCEGISLWKINLSNETKLYFLHFFFIFTTKQLFFSFENRILFSPSLENFLSFAEACKYQEFVFSKSSQIPLMTDV